MLIHPKWWSTELSRTLLPRDLVNSALFFGKTFDLNSSTTKKLEADEVLREWRESAAYWKKHADTVRAMFSPVTEAIKKAAAIKEGDVILDVACAAGEPSLTIAETVGRAGSVTATVVVPEMVASAQSKAQRRGRCANGAQWNSLGQRPRSKAKLRPER